MRAGIANVTLKEEVREPSTIGWLPETV